MKEYDVIIAGGAVAGPVAARFCARGGLSTLLVEKDRVPREKPCSGIQFKYFEKIIGETIPRDRLCNNVLDRVVMFLPDGRSIATPGKFPMLNFMRDVLDEWLCRTAERYGAEFRDACAFKGLEETGDGFIVTLKTGSGTERVAAKYVIDATGLRPVIRRLIREDRAYAGTSTGATINYYFSADGDLDKNTLYQFWNIDFNNMMFAWVYNKTLSDGKDYWVVGTGYDRGIKERQEIFFNHVKKKFNLSNVKMVKREGYSASLSFDDRDRIWLGRGNVLMVGDAAGLIDLTRGVGMDAAALSGRLAARAVLRASKKGSPAIGEYERLMARLVKQTKDNQEKGILKFTSNDELAAYLRKSFLRMSLRMLGRTFMNKFRSGEKQVMIP
jgi:flavin-dependent dehydrogenase